MLPQKPPRHSYRIDALDLPIQAKKLISNEQWSYIDEFCFYQLDNGLIEAHYANQKLATWDGKSWQDPFNRRTIGARR
jgi:hypothetical protein